MENVSARVKKMKRVRERIWTLDKEKIMRMYELSIVMVCVLAAAALIGTISGRYLGKDNLIEQVAEAVIEQETGMVVDLSPEEKPEEKNEHPIEQDAHLKEVADTLIQEQTQLKADVSPETVSEPQAEQNVKVPA